MFGACDAGQRLGAVFLQGLLWGLLRGFARELAWGLLRNL